MLPRSLALAVPAVFGLANAVLAAEVGRVQQPDDGQLSQGFFFDWTTLGSPIPVVEQCEILDIKWSRGAATGPNPTSPYVLQIYTSTFITPLIVDAGSGQEYKFPVPFRPDTQFQICMFDKHGVTGGCQRIMTVIPPRDSSPTCANLTYPRPDQLLDVEALDSTGVASQYGWPSQCTDLSLTPNNGTPPYTMTIAPTLHPPYNFTLNQTAMSINWTIALSWGSPFFISLADAAGNAWSYGPLHSGQGTTHECLSPIPADKRKEDSSLSSYVAVGAGVGGGVGGLLLGLLAAFLIHRRQQRNARRVKRMRDRDSILGHETPVAETPFGALQTVTQLRDTHGRTVSTTSAPSHLRPADSYKVEPWVPPSQTLLQAGQSPPSTPVHGVYAHTASSPLSPPPAAASSDPAVRQRESRGHGSHVYVVHHDGGRAPVSVYTEDGTEVVELPPRYTGDENAQSGSGTRRRPSLFQRRLPNPVRKDGLRPENPNDRSSVNSPTSPDRAHGPSANSPT